MPDRPVLNALEALDIKVRHTFRHTLQDASWGKPQLMSKALEGVLCLFDTPGENVSRKSVECTLAAFRGGEACPPSST